MDHLYLQSTCQTLTLVREGCAEARADCRDVHELRNGGAHAHVGEGCGKGVRAGELEEADRLSGGAVGKGAWLKERRVRAAAAGVRELGVGWNGRQRESDPPVKTGGVESPVTGGKKLTSSKCHLFCEI